MRNAADIIPDADVDPPCCLVAWRRRAHEWASPQASRASCLCSRMVAVSLHMRASSLWANCDCPRQDPRENVGVVICPLEAYRRVRLKFHLLVLDPSIYNAEEDTVDFGKVLL